MHLETSKLASSTTDNINWIYIWYDQTPLTRDRLVKGAANHYDLLVIAILNGFLTMFGFPMMHGVLPYSSMHVRSLSDIEVYVGEDRVREV